MVVHYTLKDYDRMKEYADEIIDESGYSDGQPKSKDISDQVANKVIKREEVTKRISAIDEAFEEVPVEYQEGLALHIFKDKPFPDYASRSTWSRVKSKFYYSIAKKLHLI